MSTIQVYTPSQPPFVGGASKLHGEPQSQLHSPSREPDNRHFVAVKKPPTGQRDSSPNKACSKFVPREDEPGCAFPSVNPIVGVRHRSRWPRRVTVRYGHG